MAIRLTKAWLPVTAENIQAVPGQLGVFELADESSVVRYIGAGTAQSLFGLRSAIADAATLHGAALFRYEVNTAYTTRRLELLMTHVADHGVLPPGNDDVDPARLGRLHPS